MPGMALAITHIEGSWNLDYLQRKWGPRSTPTVSLITYTTIRGGTWGPSEPTSGEPSGSLALTEELEDQTPGDLQELSSCEELQEGSGWRSSPVGSSGTRPSGFAVLSAPRDLQGPQSCWEELGTNPQGSPGICGASASCEDLLGS